MKIKILIFACLYSVIIEAQPEFQEWTAPSGTSTFHTHGTTSAFPAIRISEDFGPRQLNTQEYQWHGGIDYNSDVGNTDYGDLILALEDGNISEYSKLRTGTKALLIEGAGHNLRYVHVFTSGTLTTTNQIETGGCLLKTMDAPNNFISTTGAHDTWAIIIRDGGVYTAYGPEPPTPPGMVTFTDESGTSQTIVVNTTVVAGDPLVSLGDSDGFPAHLHLEILTRLTDLVGNAILPGDDRWAKDPLQLFPHPSPIFNIDFYHQNDITQGIEIMYPGIGEETIQTRVEISGQAGNTPANRYTAIMNVDDLEIFIKKPGGAFAFIQGPNKESRFSHGGRIGSGLLNMTHRLANANCGVWSRTHMQPFAYAGTTAPNGHHPRDDYYFADFVSRINKGHLMGGATTFADLPGDARYNDGKYDLKAVVTDVGSGNQESPILNFTLDNFKPFIENVIVNYNSTIIYEGGWLNNDPIPALVGDGFISQKPTITAGSNLMAPYPLEGITIQVNVSESLEQLFLDINDEVLSTPYVVNETGTAVDPEMQTWQFNIPYGDLPIETCFQMVFYGNDCTGNDLLELANGINNFIPARQNTLNDATTWSAGPAEGNDLVHKFCINDCGKMLGKTIASKKGLDCLAGEDIVQSATPASDATSNNGTVAIDVNSYDPGYTIEWKALGGNKIISTANQVLDLLPGIYCWTVSDLDCCSEFSNCIEVQDCSNATPLLLHTVAICRKNTIDLQVSGGMPPYTYEWTHPSFPNLPTSQDLNAPRFGNYCVEVTDACGQRETICQEVGIDPQLYSVIIYDVCLGPDGLGMIDLYSSNAAPDGYTFIWSTGSTESDLTEIDFPGEYCVTITNASNCETSECFFVRQGGGANSLEAMTSKTCYEANEGTIALTNVSNTLNFQWDNGATGYEISGLDAGQYCVTVSSANCADINQCFEIEYNCCTEIAIDATVQLPTSCNANNGGITFQQGGSVTGAVDPWTFLWNTGHTGPSIQDLGPGFFSLTITDAIGCTASEQWDLNIEDIATNVVSQPTCENESNGVGIVIASSSGNLINIQGDFKFSWSDGFLTEGGQASTRDDLDVGMYTVTISDLESSPPCEIIVELNVGETPMDGPFELSSEISLSCANEGTGKITVSPSGGNTPYVYSWSNGSSFKDLNNVPAGNYTLTVEDVCGREIIESFNLIAFTPPIVEIAEYGGCEGDGWAQVNISHDYEYELEWKNVSTSDGLYLENVFSQFPPEYTLIDENGCEYSGVLDVYFGSSFTDIEVVHTCEGLADGTIQGWIGVQYLQEELTVKVNSDIYTFNPSSSPYFLSIGGLNSGPKDVRIINGDCVEDYDVVIENLLEEGDLVGLHFDEDLNQHFCEFERHCEGQGNLPTTLEPSDVDFFDNRRSCKFPVFCGDTDMDTKVKFKKQKLKTYLYRTLLQQIEINPEMVNFRFPLDLPGQRLTELNNTSADDCDWIKYCPVNLQITDVIHNPSSTTNWASFNNGCPMVSCHYGGIFGISIDNVHSNYCFQNQNLAPYIGLNVAIDIEDFIPDNTDGQCFLQTNRLVEVWRSYQAGNLDYLPNLESTQIFTDIIEEHLSEFQSGARYLNCSKVRWCANDGTVDFIEYTPNEHCLYVIPEDQNLLVCDIEGDLVWCFNTTQNYIVAYFLEDDIGPKQFKNNDDTFDHHIVNLTTKDDYIGMTVNTDVVVLEDTTFVHSNYNYIRETYYGKEHVDFYSKSRSQEPEFLTSNITDIFSNDFYDQDVYIHQLNDYEKIIEITTDSEEDFLDFAYQSWADILSVDHSAQEVVLHCYHQYDININGVNYSGDEDGSFSVINYNIESNQVNVRTVHNISRSDLFVNKHGDSPTSVVLHYSGDAITSSSFSIPANLYNGLFTLNHADSTQTPGLVSLAGFEGDFDRVTTLDYLEGSMLSFVVQGKGLISLNDLGSSIYLDEPSNYISVDFNNMNVFSKSFKKGSFANVSTAIVSNSNVSGFGLALAHSDKIRLDNNEYTADGEQDLLFFRFDPSGAIIQQEKWGKTFATVHLKDFILNPFNAYFGGQIVGVSDEMVVGNQKFIFHDDYTQHSFMASQVLSSNQTFKSDVTEYTESNDEFDDKGINIYPNPTQEELIIELSGEDNLDFTYSVFTVDGTIIKTDPQMNFRKTLVNLSTLPSGVYVLELIRGDQKSYHKVVKYD